MREKKRYHVPRFERHGSIEQIMKAFGGDTINDTIFNADGTVRGMGEGEVDGFVSTDGTLLPCPVQPEVCAS